MKKRFWAIGVAIATSLAVLPARAGTPDYLCYYTSQSGFTLDLSHLCGSKLRQEVAPTTSSVANSTQATSKISVLDIRLLNRREKTARIVGQVINQTGQSAGAISIEYQVRLDETSVFINGRDTHILAQGTAMIDPLRLSPNGTGQFNDLVWEESQHSDKKITLENAKSVRITSIKWIDEKGKKRSIAGTTSHSVFKE